MHYQLNFSRIPASFALKRPSSVIISAGENILELNFSTSNEIVVCEGIAIPYHNIDLSQTLNQRENKLLLKNWVFPSIGAGSSTELGGGIFETNVGILS